MAFWSRVPTTPGSWLLPNLAHPCCWASERFAAPDLSVAVPPLLPISQEAYSVFSPVPHLLISFFSKSSGNA